MMMNKQVSWTWQATVHGKMGNLNTVNTVNVSPVSFSCIQFGLKRSDRLEQRKGCWCCCFRLDLSLDLFHCEAWAKVQVQVQRFLMRPETVFLHGVKHKVKDCKNISNHAKLCKTFAGRYSNMQFEHAADTVRQSAFRGSWELGWLVWGKPELGLHRF